MSANAQTTQEENWGRARPIQQEVNKSLVHYLFLPVDLSAGQVPGGGLDVNHTVMNTGLRLVRRGRLALAQVLLRANVDGVLALHRLLQKFVSAYMPQFPDGVG